MAEFSYPFNAVETSPGVFDREYDASYLARAFNHLQNGVAIGVLNSLIVTAGAGLNTTLGTGLAYINGIFYYNDAALTKAHDAADATYDRIDYVALRLDTAARTITSVVLKGAPAAVPAPPALTSSAAIVEIALYEVIIRKTATTIAAGDITPAYRGNFFSLYKNPMNLNEMVQTGWFSGNGITNGPSGITTGLLYVNQYGNTQANIKACSQILIDYNTGDMYSRYRTTTNVWSAWVKYLTTDNDDTVTFRGDFIRPNIPHAHGTSGVVAAIAANTDYAVTLGYATNIGGWTIDGNKLVVPKTGLYQINMFAEMYVVTNDVEMFLKAITYSAANATLGTYTLDTRCTYAKPTSWLRPNGAIQLLLNAGEKISLVVRHAAASACDLKSARMTIAQIAGTL